MTDTWPEFFQIVLMHRTGRSGNMPIQFVTQLDDHQIDNLAENLGMMTLPLCGRDSGMSFEAEQWKKEYAS